MTLTLYFQLSTVSITSCPLATSEPGPCSLKHACVARVCVYACARLGVHACECVWGLGRVSGPVMPLLLPFSGPLGSGRAGQAGGRGLLFCPDPLPIRTPWQGQSHHPPFLPSQACPLPWESSPPSPPPAAPGGSVGHPGKRRLTPRALPCTPGRSGGQRLPVGAPASMRDA